jgi:hypothetical protein
MTSQEMYKVKIGTLINYKRGFNNFDINIVNSKGKIYINNERKVKWIGQRYCSSLNFDCFIELSLKDVNKINIYNRQ